MKALVVFFLALTSLNSHAFGVKAKEGIWITPEPLGASMYNAGDKVSLRGKICLYKKHPIFPFKNKCIKLKDHPKYKSFTVRMFFPDAATEITDSATLTEVSDGLEYSVESPALVAGTKHQLIVMIEENNKVKDRLFEINAKVLQNLEALKVKMEEKELRLSEKGKKGLEKMMAILDKIIIRVKRKKFINPHMFAEYHQPVPLKNEVSAPMYYSTLFGGMRLSMEALLGNPLNGEKTKVIAKAVNVNFVEDPEMTDSKYDQYKWKYQMEFYDKEQKVHTSESKLMDNLDEFVHEYQTDALSFSEINSYQIKLIRSKDVPNLPPLFSWLTKQQWGLVNGSIDVLEDNTSPLYKNVPEMAYVQNWSVVDEITDELGRIARDSITARQVGETLSGEARDLALDVGIEALSEEVSESLGADKASNHYILNMAAATQEEGLYQIMIQSYDTSGNFAQPHPQVYPVRIDRTKPVIELGQDDNQLTNVPSFDLPIKVTDHSPVSIKVYRNEELVGESEEAEYVQSVPLQEEDNKIVVKVVDAAGNESEASLLNIHLDTIAPELVESYPAEGEIIRFLNFNVTAKANEPLLFAEIDGKVISELNGALEIGTDITKVSQGQKILKISLTDLAGNTSVNEIEYQILLKLIRTELISVVQSENLEKLTIIGAPGAVVPNIIVELDGGFFNDTEATVNPDGSFEAELDYFQTATLEAYYAPLDKTEIETISSNVNTSLTGIVKDALLEDLDKNIDGGIAGVTVTVQETGRSAVTDGQGIF
jgi:hypothetical protein